MDKLDQNGPGWAQMDQIDPNELKSTQMVQLGPNGPRWSQMDQIGPN